MFKSFIIFFDVCCLHFIRLDHPTAVFPSTEKRWRAVAGSGGSQTDGQTGLRNTLAFYAGSCQGEPANWCPSSEEATDRSPSNVVP